MSSVPQSLRVNFSITGEVEIQLPSEIHKFLQNKTNEEILLHLFYLGFIRRNISETKLLDILTPTEYSINSIQPLKALEGIILDDVNISQELDLLKEIKYETILDA